MKEKLTIQICTPGNNFSADFIQGYIDIVLWGVRNKCIMGFNFIRGANIYKLRDNLISLKGGPIFEGKEYDYVLWIDSDQVFNANCLQTLIDADKDIITALIRTDTPDRVEYAQNINGERLTPETLPDKEHPFEVDTAGFGFTLIKQGVYELLEYPYHGPEWTDKTEYTSEDDGFAIKAKRAGFTLHAHPKVLVGHEKRVIL